MRAIRLAGGHQAVCRATTLGATRALAEELQEDGLPLAAGGKAQRCGRARPPDAGRPRSRSGGTRVRGKVGRMARSVEVPLGARALVEGRKGGLEPPPVFSPQDPESCASANSATFACRQS